jgi:hypothetical protein
VYDYDWDGTPLYEVYDGTYVQVTRKDGEAVHISFSLAAGIPGPDLDVDMGLDLRFVISCRTPTDPPSVTLRPENVTASADFQWLMEALLFWLEDDIARTIERTFP